MMGQQVPLSSDNPYACYPEQLAYGCYYPQPMSNIKYNNGKVNLDANITTNGVICAVGGAIVGACLAYYFLNNKKN